jgi:UDP-N-acetylmuramoyl-L-alanyl-D-glutamate--2,6-diaminopimelate ligase
MLGTVEYDLISQKRAAPLTTPGAIELYECLAAARDAGADSAVFEVSSHALDQGRCDGLLFSAGVYTNLTGDHLDYHANMDSYAAAKKRLFEMLPHDAIAVINADDPRGAQFASASHAHIVFYGIESQCADVRSELPRLDRSGASFVLHSKDTRVPIRLPLIGMHNVSNALAAAATALGLGLPLDAIRQGLEVVRGVPGRLQRVEPNGWPFSVLVDYAHTDDALRNVLTALRPLTPGRLICVFGCGGDRDRGKRPRMAAVVAELAEVAFVTSDNPRSESPAAIIDQISGGFPRNSNCRVKTEVDRRTAVFAAINEARAGDTVLIAGKGHENYQLVGDCVLHFDDVEVARDALQHRNTSKQPALQEEVA